MASMAADTLSGVDFADREVCYGQIFEGLDNIIRDWNRLLAETGGRGINQVPKSQNAALMLISLYAAAKFQNPIVFSEWQKSGRDTLASWFEDQALLVKVLPGYGDMIQLLKLIHPESSCSKRGGRKGKKKQRGGALTPDQKRGVAQAIAVATIALGLGAAYYYGASVKTFASLIVKGLSNRSYMDDSWCTGVAYRTLSNTASYVGATTHCSTVRAHNDRINDQIAQRVIAATIGIMGGATAAIATGFSSLTNKIQNYIVDPVIETYENRGMKTRLQKNKNSIIARLAFADASQAIQGGQPGIDQLEAKLAQMRTPSVQLYFSQSINDVATAERVGVDLMLNGQRLNILTAPPPAAGAGAAAPVEITPRERQLYIDTVEAAVKAAKDRQDPGPAAEQQLQAADRREDEIVQVAENVRQANEGAQPAAAGAEDEDHAMGRGGGRRRRKRNMTRKRHNKKRGRKTGKKHHKKSHKKRGRKTGKKHHKKGHKKRGRKTRKH